MRILIISWKKLLCFCIVIILGLVCLSNIKGFKKTLSAYAQFQTYFEPEKPKKGSLEELYQDIFMALLDDYIDESVGNYYIEQTGYYPNVDPWANKVLYIKRPNGYRTFLFEMKLEVQPYLGAHNSIGVDHITMTISTSGVEIIGYKHIKDYPIPPWLEKIE